MHYKYEEMSHAALAALPKEKTVVFMPISPLEEHGPHLPLGVDAFLARFFTDQIIERLSKTHEGWHFVIMPTVFAGSDTLTYLGSIEIPQRVIYDLTYATARKLAKDGFRKIIAVSGHGGPKHIVALEEVASRVSWRCKGTKMISATGPLLMDVVHGKHHGTILEKLRSRGGAVTEDQATAMRTDYHAGMIETSLMMLARPDLVNASYKDLGPAIVTKPWKIRKSSGMKVAGGLGHLGSPSYSSVELGQACADVLLDAIEPKIVGFLANEKGAERKFRSFLYFIPIFRTHFPYLFISMVSVVVFLLALSYFMRMLAHLGGTLPQ